MRYCKEEPRGAPDNQTRLPLRGDADWLRGASRWISNPGPCVPAAPFKSTRARPGTHMGNLAGHPFWGDCIIFFLNSGCDNNPLSWEIVDSAFAGRRQTPDKNELTPRQTEGGRRPGHLLLAGARQGLPLCQNFLMNKILGILSKTMNPLRRIPDVRQPVFLAEGCGC